MQKKAVAAFVSLLAILLISSPSARADTNAATPEEKARDAGTQAESESWAVHGQATFVEQYHPAFRSPYRGPNSFDPGSRGDETFDATLYLGARVWDGAEAWFDGEVDQGFGLSNTLGIAGFPNAEGSKVGSASPYPKLPRLFLRQTIGLGGGTERVDPDANQLGGERDKSRLVTTVGKFSVTDVFDTNAYSHDSKNSFLNWTLNDLGTFDYAANAWGYTEGIAEEWYQDWWTARVGYFALSTVPNGGKIDRAFARQFEVDTELEERHTLWDRPGALRLLGFLNHGRMGLFKDAIALSQASGNPADISLVRHLHERVGVGINLEQQVADDAGIFLRAGYDDASRESFEFTDVDRSLSGGISLQGNRWQRPDDVAGLAFVVNGISRQHQTYFNDGGLGILVGDGKLTHPGDEKIVEAFYNFVATKWLKLSADYQFVDNPAYNADRGPVSILGARLHAEF
jgi:high affinity Mn2+ porin